MPTTKRRHAIIETEEVSHALDVARIRWPGEPATRLLSRLIEEGAAAVEHEGDTERAEHERATRALTELAHFYPAGYLDHVREGWDE